MNPITDPQREHLRNLDKEIQALNPEALMMPNDFLDQLTSPQASTIITSLTQTRDKLRREERTQELGRIEAELTEETFYVTDGTTYRTRRARGSGNLYALRLVETPGEQPRLEYDKGAIFRIAPRDRANPDQAREIAARYGHQTGQCMICGRTLTNPESIEVGIGPICVKRV